MGYQPRNNLVKDENGDLLADSHNILNKWKNNFSQLLNVNNVSDVRQTEVHKAEPLVPGPSRLEVEISIAELKKYKSASSDQIPAELIQAGGGKALLCSPQAPTQSHIKLCAPVVLQRLPIGSWASDLMEGTE
jgi:hypothetical protein